MIKMIGLVHAIILGLCICSCSAFVLQPKVTTVNIHDLKSPQPLLLKPSAYEYNERYYWPKNSDGDIDFEEGDVVTLACPGRKLMIGSKNANVESAEAVHSNGLFDILGQSVRISSVKCTSHPFHTARYTGGSCLGVYDEAEIGWELEDEFISHIRLCFDRRLQTTLYAQFNMTRAIEGHQGGVSRPSFVQDDFFSVGSVNALYNRNAQRAAINRALGLPANDYKYVSKSDDHFLSRGHLAAKADFVYEGQQRFTFHYVNAAPQWQTFNGANWNTLEQDVRRYVGQQDEDVVVYAGTHGIATLPHERTDEDVELYLHTGGENALPIPRLFWRALYKPSEKSGVVFVGVNNPYVFNEELDVVCKDVCDQIDWLHWKPSNFEKGFSYCCDVNDFRSVVKSLPEFTVNSLLH